jgi:hypothetical protein
MKILDIKKIDTSNHDKVTFIRIEPITLEATVTDIILNLSNLSWISKFDDEYIRESFIARAKPTIDDITAKLKKSSTDKISSEAGEYVVSELSRKIIVNEMQYLDIPISELYSKKISGNPGFDYHTQNDCEVIIFGEAKYVSDSSAYRSGLGQVVKFINEKKDVKDLADLRDFCSRPALQNVIKNRKGYAVGFSAKSTPSDILIDKIINNKDYKKLLEHEEIILVAVNL